VQEAMKKGPTVVGVPGTKVVVLGLEKRILLASLETKEL
jgi:20S proteasome alpha/beta subunit